MSTKSVSEGSFNTVIFVHTMSLESQGLYDYVIENLGQKSSQRVI
jgi:hypothetical protein